MARPPVVRNGKISDYEATVSAKSMKRIYSNDIILRFYKRDGLMRVAGDSVVLATCAKLSRRFGRQIDLMDDRGRLLPHRRDAVDMRQRHLCLAWGLPIGLMEETQHRPPSPLANSVAELHSAKGFDGQDGAGHIGDEVLSDRSRIRPAMAPRCSSSGYSPSQRGPLTLSPCPWAYCEDEWPLSTSAIFTRSASERAPIFRMTWPRWILTVISLIPSSPAICLFIRPAATRLITSRSR